MTAKLWASHDLTRSAVSKQLSIPQQSNQDQYRALAEALLECKRLRVENDRLHAILAAHGISPSAVTVASGEAEHAATGADAISDSTLPNTLNPSEKVALFRRLFRGRMDVYPLRWENKAGKSGYAPACGNDKTAG